MKHREPRKKFIVTLGGLAVFIIGAVLGSFLVLGADISEGKSFFLKNSASFGNDVVDENAASMRESFLSKNYTDDLFTALQKDATKVGTTTHFNREKAALYVEQEIAALFPTVRDADIRINGEASVPRYVQTMDEHYVALSLLFQKVLQGSLSLPSIDSKLRTDLQKTALLLGEAGNEMKNILVPPEYVDFHKQSLEWVGATKNLIEAGLLAQESDPLRMLVALGGLEDVQAAALNAYAELSIIIEENGT